MLVVNDVPAGIVFVSAFVDKLTLTVAIGALDDVTSYPKVFA